MLTALLVSCGQETDQKPAEQQETMTSGEFTAYVDGAIFDLMDTTFTLYREEYPKVTLTTVRADTRDAMRMLLAGKTRAAVISRDYLPDEEKLMEKHAVEKHQRMHILDDALVLFTHPDFPLDTLHASQVKEILTDKSKGLKDYYPQLNKRPQLVTMHNNSSVYANIRMMICEGEEIERPMKYFMTPDSVRDYIANNEKANAIGIAYLSHVVHDPSFKTLPIGYADSTGKYVSPKPVHQAYIVMGKYPWTVKYYVYLLRDLRKLPYWFATFLAKESYIQRYFKEAGLVPAYAKIVLKHQE
jgi:hypothetical protein